MWVGHPLCTAVQTSAHRKCLRSHKIEVTLAPRGAARLWTILHPHDGKGGGRGQVGGSSKYSTTVVSQVLWCQYLVVSVSSGAVCRWDAVMASTCYLSPAYCYHGDFFLHLFLGMNGMICHHLELQMLKCGFTSPGHWQI